MSIFDKISYNYSDDLYRSAEATVIKSRMDGLQSMYGIMDIKSGLFAVGGEKYDDAAQQIGRELGINKNLEDDNVSFDHYISSTNDRDNYMFQGEDGNLYNLNFTDGGVDAKSTEQFAEENGLAVNGDKFYDVVDFGQNSAEFIDYAFEGLGDGVQNRDEINLGNNTWSSINWVRQEVDSSLWGSGGSNTQSQIANNAFSNIVKHSNQWLKATDYAELKNCTTYSEYLQKIAELALKSLDEVSNSENEEESTEEPE